MFDSMSEPRYVLDTRLAQLEDELLKVAGQRARYRKALWRIAAENSGHWGQIANEALMAEEER